MIKYSVIIIHWQTPELLESQLRHLSPTSESEVIVVDNNTLTDQQHWKEKFPTTTFIFLDKNYGFATAGNRGAAIAKGKWYLFLNPDVSITYEQINSMIAYGEKKQLSAVSADFDDERYRKPIPSFSSLLIEFTPLKHFFKASAFNHTRTIVGGCFVITASAFNHVGGWDEHFFLWFEDSDLTKRLTNAHLEYGFVKLPITHQGGASFESLADSEKRKLFFTSMNTYAKKHFNQFEQKLIVLLTKHFTA